MAARPQDLSSQRRQHLLSALSVDDSNLFVAAEAEIDHEIMTAPPATAGLFHALPGCTPALLDALVEVYTLAGWRAARQVRRHPAGESEGLQLDKPR